MAGIGFTLKKLFSKDTFINRTKAYAFSALVASGPWLSAVLVVNILLIVAEHFIIVPAQRFLFMGTIVYSFIFSQIITAPWQFIITRYVSDKLFKKEYDFIQPSFTGLSKVVFTIALILAVIFYIHKPLPAYYIYLAGSLFLILTLIWIIMVFLSAAKNYGIIAKAFIVGGAVSVVLTFILLRQPILFEDHIAAGNILLAYILGLIVTYIILLHSFYSTFTFGNGLEFDFLRYLNKVAALFFIGLFYTLAIWIDTILVWYSKHGAIIYETFRYAHLYDHAKFLAFLTIIPTAVLFLVYVETEFYDKYKKYYQTVREKSTFDEITEAKNKMINLIYRHLVYLLERQTLITLTIIVLSEQIFVYLGFPMLINDIFRICALAALCNAMVLVTLLILLYFEARKEALYVSVIFFVANLLLTGYLIPPETYYLGLGLFLSALIALITSIFMLIIYFKKLDHITFASQPFFLVPDKGLFVNVADNLNDIYMYFICDHKWTRKQLEYRVCDKVTNLSPPDAKRFRGSRNRTNKQINTEKDKVIMQL